LRKKGAILKMEPQTGLGSPEIVSPPLKKPLKMRQVAFVDALASGHTITKAAEIAGVNRRQAHRWLEPGKPTAIFLAEQGESLKRTLGERLLTLTALSLDHLENTLSQPSGVWHDRKTEAARITLDTILKILAKEGHRHENNPTND
jgi:hypothetical protein